MKLPEEVKTNHKIRDLAIVKLFCNEGLTLDEIGLRFNITGSRVHQILYKNRHLVTYEKSYEKIKRLNALMRLLKKYPENIGSKSTLDIVEQLRKEVEGDKANVQVNISKTFVYLNEKAVEEENAGNNRIKTELQAEQI